MKKITAVIPTLLKKVSVLNKLTETLAEDSSVEEIIIINNSQESFSYDNPKVRIISKGENLFVNPSWNLGVSEAKSDYVTLVNDDIIIPQNFCSLVLDKIDDKSGIIGIDTNFVKTFNDDNINEAVENCRIHKNEILLTAVRYRPANFGIMMFFKKDVYRQIPDDLKIFFGDDYIMYFAQKAKKENAIISGQTIFHYGSLSSKKFNNFASKENKLYKKYVYPWYKRIFCFYERDTHYAMYILFLNFSIKKNK